MPITPFNIPAPQLRLGDIGQLMQLQQLKQTQDLQQQAQEKQQRLGALMGQAGPDLMQSPQVQQQFVEQAYNIDPAQAMKFQQQFQQMNFEQKKRYLLKAKEDMEIIGDRLSSVTNPQEYQFVKDYFNKIDVDAGFLPDEYNPRTIDFFTKMGQSSVENLDRSVKQLNIKNMKAEEGRKKSLEQRVQEQYDFDLKLRQDKWNRLQKGMVTREQVPRFEMDMNRDLTKDLSTFVKHREYFNNINTAYNAPPDNRGISDVSLIFNYMKMLDPTSVVQKGEQILVQNAASYKDRVIQWANSVSKGDKLSQSVRDEIYRLSKEYLTTSRKHAQGIYNQTKLRAENAGVNFDNVKTGIEMSLPWEKKENKPAASRKVIPSQTRPRPRYYPGDLDQGKATKLYNLLYGE